MVNPLALDWPANHHSTKRLSLALARLDVERDPLIYAMMSDDEIEAHAQRNAYMHEAYANHILHALVVGPEWVDD